MKIVIFNCSVITLFCISVGICNIVFCIYKFVNRGIFVNLFVKKLVLIILYIGNCGFYVLCKLNIKIE